DGPGVRCASCTHYQKRHKAVAAVSVNRGLELCRFHLQIAINRDLPHGCAAETAEARRLVKRMVAFRGDVEHGLRPQTTQAIASKFRKSMCERDEQRCVVCFRTARRHHAVGGCRIVAEPRTEGANYVPFYFGSEGIVLPNRKLRIEGGNDCVRCDSDRCGSRIEQAEIPRMGRMDLGARQRIRSKADGVLCRHWMSEIDARDQRAYCLGRWLRRDGQIANAGDVVLDRLHKRLPHLLAFRWIQQKWRTLLAIARHTFIVVRHDSAHRFKKTCARPALSRAGRASDRVPIGSRRDYRPRARHGGKEPQPKPDSSRTREPPPESPWDGRLRGPLRCRSLWFRKEYGEVLPRRAVEKRLPARPSVSPSAVLPL